MSQSLITNVKDQDLTNLYEDWVWLINSKDLRNALYITKFGNLFYQKEEGFIKKSTSVWLLDIIHCTLSKAAVDSSELEAKLTGPNARDFLWEADLIAQLEQNGQTLPADTIYSLKSPLQLGGQLILDNIEASDKTVAISIAGQVGEQTRHLTTGTIVKDVKIN
jgi:hypothetical protein